MCRLYKSGIYSPDWPVYLCRWATWDTGRPGVPGGQETFTDRRGRIIIYCNGGLGRKSTVTSPSTSVFSFSQTQFLQPNEVINIHMEARCWTENSFFKKPFFLCVYFIWWLLKSEFFFFTILLKESDISADISNMWNWCGLRMTFILRHVAIPQSQHPSFIDASYIYLSIL